MNNIKIHSESHNYNVIVYDNIVKLIEKHIPSDKKLVVIHDSFFNNSSILEAISKTNKTTVFVSTDAGEDAKSLQKYEEIINILTENDISKNDLLIALGGGSITDLVGFIAATYKRGIEYISIPTTTLSMIDASIGGKTALNFKNIKNVIGVVNPPRKVLMGLDVLNTLDDRQYNNGLVEAIKIGMILDKYLFNLFINENNIKTNFKNILTKSIKLKAKIVRKDEFDQGSRRCLNFGHTIGHAIELMNQNLLHGEAVANGILIVSKEKDYFNDIKNLFIKLNIPIIDEINIDEILKTIKNDKKVKNNKINLVEVEHIGKYQIKEISVQEMKGVLESYAI